MNDRPSGRRRAGGRHARYGTCRALFILCGENEIIVKRSKLKYVVALMLLNRRTSRAHLSLA